MAKIKINGDSSGYVEIAAPNAANNNTLELGPGTKILTDKNTHTGNIGIGTDDPGSNKLQVQGGSALYGNGGASAIWGDTSYLGALSFDGSAQPVIRAASSKALIFQVNQSTEALRITSDGKVGINEPSPDQALHVKGISGDTVPARFESTGTISRIGFQASGTPSSYHVACGAEANDFIVYTNNTEKLRIKSDGNVGVGDDNPDVPFNVKAGGASFAGQTTHAKIEDTTSLAANVGGLLALEGVYNSGGDPAAFAMIHGGKENATDGNYAGYLRFLTRPSNALPQERLRIKSDGNIGINCNDPGSLLELNAAAGTKMGISLGAVGDNITASRYIGICKTADQTDLGANSGFSGIEFGGPSSTDEGYLAFHTHDLGVASGERIRLTKDGKFGIGIQSPFSRFQSGGHTFTGGNGMHSNDRVGMSNHGSLTGLMLASTYNDGTHPEYGVVFVQGPNTSSYNVWGICPDGPNKGNSLNFHYDDQATNIHAPGYRKFQMTGEGYFLQPNQPKFRVGRNGNYSPGAGSDIIFNIDSGGGKHNVGLHYNTSNGRFTAPVAGVYTFTAHVIWQSLSSGQNMADCFHPRINGTVVGYSGRRGEYIANETGNAGYYTDFMTYQFSLAANDYVTIENEYNLTVHGNSNYTTFSGHLVG